MRRIAALCCLAVLLAWALTREMTAPETAGEALVRQPSPVASDAAAPAVSRDPVGSNTSPSNLPTATGALADISVSIQERPLFSPDRKPPALPAAANVGPGNAPAGLPRLTGVIVGPNGGRAIFAGDDGKSRTAAEGDTIGEFKVWRINPGLVTMVGAAGPRVLRPAYGTASEALVTPAPRQMGTVNSGLIPGGRR